MPLKTANNQAQAEPPLSQGVRTSNAVISSGLKTLLGLGILAPVVGGGFRLVSGLYDQAQAPPEQPLPASVVPVPIKKKKLQKAAAAITKIAQTGGAAASWRDRVPFAKEDNLSVLGIPLYRSRNTDTPSFLAGHRADNIASLPWMGPAAVLLGAGGLYGGYKLVDRYIQKQRKGDMAAEVEDAKAQLLAEINKGYGKSAAVSSPSIWKLAAVRLKEAQQPTSAPAPAPARDYSSSTPAEYPVVSNLAGIGTGIGATALLAALLGGGVLGYRAARRADPARKAKERTIQQIRDQWAVAPPEVIAVPSV